MTTIYIARDTSLSDTFETNYSSPLAGAREWIRQLTVATASEVESTWTFPNSATEHIVYHVEVPLLIWGTGVNALTRLRTGASGDANVELRIVGIRRVSQDGLTIRASATLSGLTDTLPADTNVDDSINVDALNNPAGGTAVDHLVLEFECENTHAHGGAETVDIEQNLSSSTMITMDFDLPVSAGQPQEYAEVIA